MTVCPFAAWKPVGNHGGLMGAHLGLIMHVQEGNGGLSGWFNNPAAQASSTFWVSKAGALEQYVDANFCAWAQGSGNGEYNSVETEGYVGEALTAAQESMLSRLYKWGMDTYRWPKQLAESAGQQGFGWHGMGGRAWGGHTGCPGDLRKNRRQAILNAIGGAPTPAPPKPTPAPPATKAPPFPLPPGYYYGPASGPKESVSGQYPPYGGPNGAPGLKQWQTQMRSRGWTITPDGFYGTQTQSVASQFQVEKGLQQDGGKIGPQTWSTAWTAPVT